MWCLWWPQEYSTCPPGRLYHSHDRQLVRKDPGLGELRLVCYEGLGLLLMMMCRSFYMESRLHVVNLPEYMLRLVSHLLEVAGVLLTLPLGTGEGRPL